MSTTKAPRCICGDGFGMNLSCPTHGVHVRAAREKPPRLSIAERPVSEAGGCSFCHSAARKVVEVQGRGSHGVLVRFCLSCLGELTRWNGWTA